MITTFGQVDFVDRERGRMGWRYDSCEWWALASVLVGSSQTHLDGKTSLDGEWLWWCENNVASLEWDDSMILCETLAEADIVLAGIANLGRTDQPWCPVRLDDYLRWEHHQLWHTDRWNPRRRTSYRSILQLELEADKARLRAKSRRTE